MSIILFEFFCEDCQSTAGEGAGLIFHPFSLFGREKRSETIAHHVMIVVDPFDFVICHYRSVDQRQVDREQRHSAELQERTELGGLPRLHHEEVLRAYAVFPFKIESRFVAVDHAYFQWGGASACADALRTLMAVDEETDAMSGAMEICLP